MKTENLGLENAKNVLSREEMKKITGGKLPACGDGLYTCICCDGHGNCVNTGCQTILSCCA